MRNILRIYKIMFRHWGYLLVGILCMIAYAIFSGVSITMAIPLFDYVFKPSGTEIFYHNFNEFYSVIKIALIDFFNKSGSFLYFLKISHYHSLIGTLKQILSQTDPIFLLWLISISVIILVIIKNIFFYANRVLFANLRGKTVREVRDNIFHKYLYQSLAFFNKNQVGDSIVRMVSDVDIVSNLFIGSLFNAIRDIILLFVYVRLALFLNMKLFLTSLIILPIFSIIINYLGKKIKKYAKRIQAQSSSMFSNVEEVLNNMKIVKAFSHEDYELKKFKIINHKYFIYWRKSIIYSAINVPLSELNGTLIGIIVLVLGGRQVLQADSNFTLGNFSAFLFAIFSMLHPIKTLTKAYTDIKKATVSLDRISVIFNRKSEIVDEADSIEKKSFIDKIKFHNVNFSYNSQAQVLHNISFEVLKGEKVAIVGSSGAGKTTLINLLSRMYDATSGEILIDDVPIKHILLKDLRNLFGTVTQQSILFSDTVVGNIRYGVLKEVSDEQIKKAAQIAYADGFIKKFPKKYNEFLNVKASNLSGGQKQRLCIARAIVGNPPILIFDEATSSLDTEAERKVQKAIEQATFNRTVIVIAHRLSTILNSDKIVVLDQGKIVGLGKHEDLLKSCARYKTLYDLQFNI